MGFHYTLHHIRSQASARATQRETRAFGHHRQVAATRQDEHTRAANLHSIALDAGDDQQRAAAMCVQ